jgi:hypothetical protein
MLVPYTMSDHDMSPSLEAYVRASLNPLRADCVTTSKVGPFKNWTGVAPFEAKFYQGPILGVYK